LLDDAVAVVAADDGVGQVHVFDLGLQLAAMLLGDLAPMMTVILFGWPFGRVGVEQTLAQLVERGSSMKDQLLRRIRPARRTAGADSPPACAPGR
jgi:hypothetical protein